MKKVARRVQQVKRSIFDDDRVVVYRGDCLKVMASMPEASVDTIVTDPPYGLEFMGKEWDKLGAYQGPRQGNEKPFPAANKNRVRFGKSAKSMQSWHEAWAHAALRVAKPGAHLLAFGGTRTFHRLACAIEDAGWEIRDTLAWHYSSGFPKSHNVSKAIDKAKGAERTKVRVSGDQVRNPKSIKSGHGIKGGDRPWMKKAREVGYHEIDSDEPATPEAVRWQGWGTGLKPAWEPIILARKPLDGTVAECALRYGTGALNVDGCRIGSERIEAHGGGQNETRIYGQGKGIPAIERGDNPHVGRWPANAVFQHDARCVRVSEDLYACVPDCQVRILDEQSGERTSGSRKAGVRKGMGYHGAGGDGGPAIAGNSGGASRFFYTPKASTTERILGCPPGYENRHPTVKPLDLCRWLCRLTKGPDGGVVLDPFSGSGSIAVAALLEGRHAVAIELEEESANVTVARVQAALKYGEGLQNLKRYKLKGRKKLKRRR